jgi:exosortase H (IPTLxxWG-CTERM-specific)
MIAEPAKKTRPALAPWVRFVAVFALLLGAYYVVILFPWCNRLLYDYLLANAWVANAILQHMGQATTVTGVTIRSAQFAIAVRRGCDAIEPAWFFAAAVLAFPIRTRGKTLALVAGISLILLLNLVRIVSLYFIGLRMPAFFPTAHLEVWPAVFMVVVLLLWAAWIRTGASPRVA